MKSKRGLFSIIFSLILTLIAFGPQNQPPALAKSGSEAESELAALQASCLDGGRGMMAQADAFTGYTQFVRTEAGKPIRLNASLKGGSYENAARGFLTQCGGLLGMQNPANELRLMRGKMTEDGRRTTVRFQQEYKGVPVVAGELFVQFDANMDILAVGGEFLPKIYLDTDPTTNAASAQANALAAVAKEYGLDAAQLTVSEPVLKIYDSALLEPWDGPTLLVWEMEVSQIDSHHLRQYVLVNARRGNVVVSFNQVEPAITWEVRDGKNTASFADDTFLCDSADPSGCVGDVVAIDAYTHAEETYNFYLAHHGRLSYDGQDSKIISIVHHGAYTTCNAFWGGSFMAYYDCSGGNIATDDVVAHELTHAVTQYESGLFYYYQSGAINESLSDIWGEFIDLESPDTPADRWLLAEDLGTPFRNMADPTEYGDPDKMSSGFYNVTGCDDYFSSCDNGGVHTNSGVGNKAAYLMTDGDTFNGYTVTGLGVPKVAAIFYEVQTNFLTSGSDYRDLHDALLQACENLVGGSAGITSDDCVEVLDAVSAVEMDEEPYPGYNPEAPVCDSGGALDLFFDDIESATYNWNYNGVINTPNVTDYPHWYRASFYATAGDWSIYGDDYDYDGGDAASDTFVALRSRIHIPASLPNAYLRFNHAFGFEDSSGFWDGGVLEYSLNNGSTWLDAGALIDDPAYGYGGTISSSFGNPLGGRLAFVGDSHGYISTRLDLSSLLGKSVLFRWRMGTDEDVFDWGWWIDDVQVYSCLDPMPAVVTKTFKSEKARDGWVLESTETSKKGGTLNSTGRLQAGDNAADRQYRSLISFNTSSLPDNAVIISATLRVRQYGAYVGQNPFNTHGSLLADVRKTKFGTLPALQLTDFQAGASLMAAGPFNPLASSGWRNANVGSSIPFIHKTGVTQYRLRFAKDDNDDLGNDYVRFYAGETSASAPRLVVYYYVP